MLTYFASHDEYSTITNYISYVNDEPDIELHNFFSRKRLGSILGSDSFKKSMALKVKEYNLVDVPDARPLRPLICPTVHQILNTTAHFYNVSMSTLISSKPKTSNWPRLVAIYLCVKYTGHQYITIAQQLERASSNCISQAYRRVKAKVNQCEKVRDEISFIVNKLNGS